MSITNQNEQTIDDWAKETENHMNQNNQNHEQPADKYIFTKQKTQLPHKMPNANEFENKQVSELSNNELLNVILLRSESDSNIYILNDVGKFLIQCHQEKMFKKRQNDPNNNNNPKPNFDNKQFQGPKNFNKPKRNFNNNPNNNNPNNNNNNSGRFNNTKHRPVDPNRVNPKHDD
jgi:hypothetical protein